MHLQLIVLHLISIFCYFIVKSLTSVTGYFEDNLLPKSQMSAFTF